MDTVKNATAEKASCHDCHKDVAILGEELQDGAVLLKYDNEGEKITIFKCRDCFQQSQELRNFQPCEVYSRIVGYLRPVQQWNVGKQEEYKERKEFKLNKNIR